jgi:uncharacterized membrane protein YdbT with pleckstrin-like domain
MSYVSRTLGAKETVLYLTGYHWLYWLGALILVAPFVAAGLAGQSLGSGQYLVLAIAAVPMLYGVYMLVHAYALELAVTNDRFVKKSGLVSITTEEVSLDKIEEVNVNESILGRIFGYGTVDVHGTGAGAIRINMVKDPIRLRREIQSASEQLKNKGE